MIEVLYVVSNLKSSGPINILINIIKYLDREKFRPRILKLSNETKGSAENDFLKLNVKIDSLGLTRIQSIYKAKTMFITYLKNNPVDVIHSHGYRADIITSKYGRDWATCTTIHNYPYEDYKMTYGNLPGTLMAKHHMYHLNKLSQVIGCSKSVSDYLNSYNVNSVYIQNGVDMEIFSPIDKHKKDKLKTKFNLPKDKTIFISVGHLSRRKDPITMLNSFIESSIKNDSLLLVIGDGPLREECLALCKNEDSIIFTGQIANVSDYIKIADWFVSSSLAEGLPNSVLEASACGVPSILSDIPPHLEINNLEPTSGIIFNVRNTESLVKELNNLKNNNYELMSQGCKSIITNYLNARLMSYKYQSSYLNILNK